MLKTALRFAAMVVLMFAFGCRNEPAAAPQPEKPPERETTEPPRPTLPRADRKPTVEPDQESSLTDSSGRLLTGKIGTPPGEADLGIPIFNPSQITETDAGAYRLETNAGTVVGMSFATGRPEAEVRGFYEQLLEESSWEEGTGRLSGTYKGRRFVITIQPGATSSFEIQAWL